MLSSSTRRPREGGIKDLVAAADNAAIVAHFCEQLSHVGRRGGRVVHVESRGRPDGLVAVVPQGQDRNFLNCFYYRGRSSLDRSWN